MSSPITPPPRRRPKTIHQFIVLAARASFPINNDRLLARMLEMLSARRIVGDGWVERHELTGLWPNCSRTAQGLEERKRASGMVTNAVENLRKQIDHRLAWMLPHFTIKLESTPPNRATRYRLSLTRCEGPWDYQHDEAPNTLPVSFAYRFKQGAKHVAHVRTWARARPNLQLEIEAVREPPQAEWKPPKHRAAYVKARDGYFQNEVARMKQAGHPELHASDIWGIREVHVSDGEKGSTVRILTERTVYPDLCFLKRHLDELFPALRKQGTYRDWLEMEHEPRASFCPPRDALCVGVLILVKQPEVSVFVAKQRAPGGDGKWEPSAAGAASSSYYHVKDDTPDLKGQVSGVVHREVGLKVNEDKIKWLGFARGLQAGSSSAVLALVEMDLTVKQVLQKFNQRREKDDVEKLVPVPLAKAREWLEQLPIRERGEFLELTLALAAIDQGLAEAL